MGTESETLDPDPEDEEVDDPNASEENKLIKDLRKQLRAKDKELKVLRPLKETNAFLESGLGSLSEDHRIALRAVVGDDLTKDNLLAKAKLLGFNITTPTTEEQEQKNIQDEVNTINNNEQAINRSTAKPDNRDFVTKLHEAKSQQEIMELLSAEGEQHGMLVEDEF